MMILGDVSEGYRSAKALSLKQEAEIGRQGIGRVVGVRQRKEPFVEMEVATVVQRLMRCLAVCLLMPHCAAWPKFSPLPIGSEN